MAVRGRSKSSSMKPVCNCFWMLSRHLETIDIAKLPFDNELEISDSMSFETRMSAEALRAKENIVSPNVLLAYFVTASLSSSRPTHDPVAFKSLLTLLQGSTASTKVWCPVQNSYTPMPLEGRWLNPKAKTLSICVLWMENSRSKRMWQLERSK